MKPTIHVLGTLGILGILGAVSFVLSGCNGVADNLTSASAVQSAASVPQRIFIAPADPLQCANGGTVIEYYADTNDNGTLDIGETILSASAICNGAGGVVGATGLTGVQGATGAQGIGAGVAVAAASRLSCPAGGALITTFADANNNGVLDAGEAITSTSTICNGTNGSNGTNGASSHITVTAASAAACPAGGSVYSTYSGSDAPVQTVVCNGINGSNGTNGSNASFESGAVGPQVSGKTYSACHHDYIYLPGTSTAAGWLLFRHQKNGSADQGIGSTGFDVWNVDIADFLLVSEVGGVNYCQMHWDASAKVLTYSVLDSSDGLNGTTGTIKF